MRTYPLLTFTAFAAGTLLFGALPVRADDTPAAATATSTAKPKKVGRGGALVQLLYPLTLTQEQMVKIDPIVNDADAKVKALRKDTTVTDKKTKTEKARVIQQAAIDQIQPLLTDEQKKRLADELVKVQPKKDVKKQSKVSALKAKRA